MKGNSMKLYQIVLKDITRRKQRMLYASLGLVIGIATKYGANLVANKPTGNMDGETGG